MFYDVSDVRTFLITQFKFVLLYVDLSNEYGWVDSGVCIVSITEFIGRNQDTHTDSILNDMLFILLLPLPSVYCFMHETCI